MADSKEDPYAFIIDNCLYSSSQEDFLRCTVFAREEDYVTFCTVGGSSPPPADVIGGESVAAGENEVDLGKLGFRGERTESSPKLTKGSSPLVHCSGKVVIESEINDSEVAFHGDLMVKVVRPIRCVTADGVECSTDKFRFYSGGKGEGEGESTVENLARMNEVEGGMEENVVEGEEENVQRKEENVDTEVIEVGNEGVSYVETEMIEVDEEGGTGVIEEIGNVDTEVIEVDEGGEVIEVDGGNNNVKLDELSDLDVAMVDFDEVIGISKKVGAGRSKNGKMGIVDSKVGGVVDEVGNCGKIDGETSNVDMEKNEEMCNVDSKVVGVDDQQRNCGNIDEETNNVDTVEIVTKEEGEEVNCVDVGVEVNNISKGDEERGNCAKIHGEACNVDTAEVVVEAEEEEGNYVDVGVKVNNTNKEEEIVNAASRVVGVDEAQGNCAKFDGEMRNLDVKETVVEEEEENGLEIGMEINDTSKIEAIANVDLKVVEEDHEKGNCSKFNEETSNVIHMEEVVVEGDERNCVDVSVEMNNTSKEDENGMFKVDKDNREGSGKSNKGVPRGEGTRMGEDEMKGRKKRKLPRSMFEEWGEGIRNGEGCSKDANLEENRTEKSQPKDGEASIRCILDALKFLVGEKSYGGGGKVDFLETAKRRGMTFPRPRFRSAMEEDA